MAFQLPSRVAVPRGTPHLSDETFLADYPAVGAVLGASVDGDGKPRQGATITCFAEDGQLKAVVRDRHAGMALFLSLEPSGDLWGQIELYIQANPGRWRADKEPRK